VLGCWWRAAIESTISPRRQWKEGPSCRRERKQIWSGTRGRPAPQLGCTCARPAPRPCRRGNARGGLGAHSEAAPPLRFLGLSRAVAARRGRRRVAAAPVHPIGAPAAPCGMREPPAAAADGRHSRPSTTVRRLSGGRVEGHHGMPDGRAPPRFPCAGAPPSNDAAEIDSRGPLQSPPAHLDFDLGGGAPATDTLQPGRRARVMPCLCWTRFPALFSRWQPVAAALPSPAAPAAPPDSNAHTTHSPSVVWGPGAAKHRCWCRRGGGAAPPPAAPPLDRPLPIAAPPPPPPRLDPPAAPSPVSAGPPPPHPPPPPRAPGGAGAPPGGGGGGGGGGGSHASLLSSARPPRARRVRRGVSARAHPSPHATGRLLDTRVPAAGKTR